MVAQSAKAIREIAATSGTNQPATRSARRWIGARERCACETSATILASTVSRADLFGANQKRAALVQGSAENFVADLLCHRHRFAGQHRFIERGAPFQNRAVDRRFLAGRTRKLVADDDEIEGRVLLAAVAPNAPGGLRRKIEQSADGPGSLLARPQFEDLAEQSQHRDDGRGLEIDGNRAAHFAESGGKRRGANVATTL